MAIIDCVDCGGKVSRNANSCPHCGRKTPKPKSGLTTVFYWLCFLSIMGWIFAPSRTSTPALQSPTQAQAVSTVAPATSAPSTPPAAPVKPASSWDYDTSFDAMTGKTIHFATAEAKAKLYFSFPYQGGSKAFLTIRKNVNGEQDVILQVNKGQFLCHSGNCGVMVRFDENTAKLFSANEPADYSKTSIFLNNANQFITSAKKSKKVIIRATFYQEGPHDIEFATDGLEWK